MACIIIPECALRTPRQHVVSTAYFFFISSESDFSTLKLSYCLNQTVSNNF